MRQGDFASAEATKGLSDRPLETFGRNLPKGLMTPGNLRQHTFIGSFGAKQLCILMNSISMQQGDFTPAGATKGLSDRPLETFGSTLLLMLWGQSSFAF